MSDDTCSSNDEESLTSMTYEVDATLRRLLRAELDEREEEREDDASDFRDSNTSSWIDVEENDSEESVETEPMTTQANDSGLDLRPVQASIDLRIRLPANWREYYSRIRTCRQRLQSRRGRTSRAMDAGRLRGGQPDRGHSVPALIDPQYGLIYMASESESEEEEILKSWPMVPRRGNSVSDLSECSSDDEQQKNAEQSM
ncbi:uncharacterized protein LOC133843430 [Drosophila sulfurigaster albostrigata]|uniref:uncharacterized protein LOC133843430 n=1 Tax=Drosophila sulfurigaster albostrigata TaxID=89887 RepID=UPI002D21DDB5|nr:uncharacterized protein LOC133843430 [Drosophila sulfurigaster albostrigata]